MVILNANGADGRDICKKIHLDKETENIAVVLFSANPQMHKCTKECMAQDFVAKPFEISSLLKTIKTYINFKLELHRNKEFLFYLVVNKFKAEGMISALTLFNFPLYSLST